MPRIEKGENGIYEIKKSTVAGFFALTAALTIVTSASSTWFTLREQVARNTADIQVLTRTVTNHSERISDLETAVELAQRLKDALEKERAQ